MKELTHSEIRESILQHKEVDSLRESINDRGIFKACFFAGHPGSGKSYVSAEVTTDVMPRVVNTDSFHSHPSFKPFWSEWTPIRDKVKRLSQQRLALYLNGMLPLAIDSTSSNTSSLLRRVGILKSLGYDVALTWIETSLDTALKRVEQRGNEDGRIVPSKVVERIYNTLNDQKDFYASEFRNFSVIKNDDGELTDDLLRKAAASHNDFFNAPISNPIGVERLDELRSSGYRYLSDVGLSVDHLASMVQGWYH
jgi:predicted ABC-type ATPase